MSSAASIHASSSACRRSAPAIAGSAQRFLGLQGLKSLDLSRKRWIFRVGQQQMVVVEVV